MPESTSKVTDLGPLEAGAFLMFHDDDEAGVGLVVQTAKEWLYRARGAWQPIPYDSTLFHGISFRNVHPEFVAFFDALQHQRLVPSLAQTSEYVIDVKPGATATPALAQVRPFGYAGPLESRVRGLVLGLALGDAVGSRPAHPSPSGMLPSGAATQLALATVDGLLRAEVSRSELMLKQASELATSEVCESYRRWAVRRGEVPREVAQDSGWTSAVPQLALKRGSSPTTVQAILTNDVVDSIGYHALLRALPIAAWNRPQMGVVSKSIGFSHNVQRTWTLTNLMIILMRLALKSGDLDAAVAFTANEMGARTKPATHLATVRERAASQPCVPEVLRAFAPGRTVGSAVTGGLYVAMSYPDADTIAEAMEFARQAPSGNAVAAVAGAILGAVHGVHALPVELVSQLELGWVADALARDLAAVGPVGAVERLSERSPVEGARLRVAYPGSS